MGGVLKRKHAADPTITREPELTALLTRFLRRQAGAVAAQVARSVKRV